MERAMPARPQESFAPTQTLLADIFRSGLAAAAAVVHPRSLPRIQLAVGVALAGCGLFEAAFGGRAYAALLLTGATMMIVSARGRPEVSSPAEPVTSATTVAAHDLKTEMILQLAATQRAETLAPPPSALNPHAWGELMARVSHDLRTPLNAVIGFSDVMGHELFGPVGDARYREYIAHIQESGRELLKSAEDTLAITALLGGQDVAKSRVCLDQLAHELEAGPTAGVRVSIDEGAEVLCERRSLRQALVNLVSEAALRADAGAQPELSATCEDDFVILEVAVSAKPKAAATCEASLHICIARVLIELQGAKLIEIERDGRWSAVTVLSRAAQQEFFAPGTVAMGWRPHAPRHVVLTN